MFPIHGAQSQSTAPQLGQSQSTNNENRDNQVSGGASQEKNSEDSVSGIKLDLGDTGENGVHRETARFVAEQNIRIEIGQSFSFSRQTIESPVSENINVNPYDPNETTAQRLAQGAEEFLPGLVEENGGSEEAARKELQQTVQNAVEKGLEGARNQLDGGMTKEIEQIFDKIETALDRFLEVFGSEDNKSENNSSLSQLLGDQNQEATNSVQNSQQIPQSMIDLLDSNS